MMLHDKGGFKMEDQQKKENQYVITEQGDLGLGTRQLTDEEQQHVDERDRAQNQAGK
jgi:hypothetical protein